MSEERLELIKENVYMRSEIATISGIGIDTSLKEELELILEIDRLNNIINELEKWCLSWKENDKYCYLASNDKDKCRYDIWEEVLDKLKELKENK